MACFFLYASAYGESFQESKWWGGRDCLVFKGIIQEPEGSLLGRHLWAKGHSVTSSGNGTDEVIMKSSNASKAAASYLKKYSNFAPEIQSLH